MNDHHHHHHHYNRSLPMNGLSVSLTGLTGDQREEIGYKITQMGGIYCKHFGTGATHLIANSIGSEKYKVAAQIPVPIVLPEWIDDCWNLFNLGSLTRKKVDEIAASKRLPPFTGLNIAITGVEEVQRANLIQQIINNGGDYHPHLTKECTHLIASEPSGKKFEYAHKWGINVVSEAWLTDSVRVGAYLDATHYRMTPDSHTKSEHSGIFTPTRKDEAAATSTPGSSNSQHQVLQQIHPRENRFLRNCTFYFHVATKNNARIPQLRFQIEAFGGCVMDTSLEWNATHIIVFPGADSQIYNPNANILNRAKVASVDWLEDSLRQETLLPITEEYKVVLTMQPRKHQRETANAENTRSSIFNQLPTVTPGKKRRTLALDVLKKKTPGRKTMDLRSRRKIEYTNNCGVFSGMMFSCEYFTMEQKLALQEDILSNSGQFVEFQDLEIDPHVESILLVLPLNSPDTPTTACQNIVTDCWISRCIEDQLLHDITAHISFSPLPFSRPIDGFQSMVIGITGYEGLEREIIGRIAQYIGATFTENFSRKNSHLIAKPGLEQSIKLVKAKDWGIPCVSLDWLYDSARKGTCLNVAQYNLFRSQSETTPGASSRTTPHTSPPAPAKFHLAPPLLHSEEPPTSSASHGGAIPNHHHHYQNENLQISANQPDLATAVDDDVVVVDLDLDMDEQVNANNNAVEPVNNNALDPFTMVEDVKDAAAAAAVVVDDDVEDDDEIFASTYRPRFDTSMAAFSPVGQRRKSTFNNEIGSPLHLSFAKNLGKAIENVDRAENDSDKSVKPLEGVRIVLGDKIQQRRGEFIRLAVALGAEILISYSEDCTHLVHQGGRGSENYREFRLAKQANKHIVSPTWLEQCIKLNTRLQEADFPYSFNPNRTLEVTASALRDRSPSPPISIISKPTPAAPTSSTPSMKTESTVNSSNPVVSIPPPTSIVPSPLQQQQQPAPPQTPPPQVLDPFPVSRPHSMTKLAAVVDGLVLAAQEMEKVPKPKITRPTFPRTRSLHPIKEQMDDPMGEDDDDDDDEDAKNGPAIIYDDPDARNEKEKLIGHLRLDKGKNSSSIGGKTDGKRPRTLSAGTVAEIERIANMRFMITGGNAKLKQEIIATIQRLGGVCLMTENWDNKCTHLICTKPATTEKCLAAYASGCWVLKPEFVKASGLKGSFVKEDDYEWTASGSTDGPKPDVAAAAQYWRRRLGNATRHFLKPRAGAFEKWTVLLLVEPPRGTMFERVLRAGGADVIMEKVETMGKVVKRNFTHCLTDADIESTRSLQDLAKAGTTVSPIKLVVEFLLDAMNAKFL